MMKKLLFLIGIAVVLLSCQNQSGSPTSATITVINNSSNYDYISISIDGSYETTIPPFAPSNEVSINNIPFGPHSLVASTNDTAPNEVDKGLSISRSVDIQKDYTWTVSTTPTLTFINNSIVPAAISVDGNPLPITPVIPVGTTISNSVLMGQHTIVAVTTNGSYENYSYTFTIYLDQPMPISFH